MTRSLVALLALAVAGVSAVSFAAPALSTRDNSGLTPGCENTNTSRKCWGEHDINTNYYDTIFYTGNTVEYWLSIDEVECAPDGYKRLCQLVNGTMPGPTLRADWGDNVVVHVTNNLVTNGTAIHWHGIRQLNSNQYDGVPGVSQCPIPPGQSMTYRFHASQYGTAMYHGHFSLQYSMGLYGPLIINGPATADYDEDLGAIFLSDWEHMTAWDHWATISTFNVTFNGLPTGLINGVNTGNCTLTNSTALDPNCIDGGKKFELAFEPGKRYRLRIVNLASEGWFQFSIDGHRMTVIQTDLVPIVPYESDNVLVNMGQRYDIIVEANATPGDYWMRSGFVTKCIPNGDAENLTGIVRYNKASTATPTTVSTVVKIENCLDEPAAKLVPWMPVDLTNMKGGIQRENVTGEYHLGKYLRWSINQPHGGFVWTNWSQPALGDVVAGHLEAIPRSNNVFQVGASNPLTAAVYNNASIEKEYVLLVIEELTPIPGISHPLHLHGHDFLIVAAKGNSRWDGTMDGWQLKNPVRRDTASLPQNGYIIIAWALDNPGLWLLHCHIAWHSSQGFGSTVLESPAMIPGSASASNWEADFEPVCKDWNEWYATSEFPQEDSGI